MSIFKQHEKFIKAQLIGIWRYRFFIFSSIRNEFRSRFIRSRLGGLWMIIHPLVQAAIFALVLGKLMGARLPGMSGEKFAYGIYILSGILVWSLFSEVISRCLTLFIDNGNLLKKIVFPRICLPLIVAGSALFNNLLLFLATIIVFGLLGHVPGAQIVWVPLLMLLTLALGLGLGLLLGVLNVFMRDMGQVVPVALQLGFWFTPIIYPMSIVPEALHPILYMNPMTTVVESFHSAMLFNTSLDLIGLGVLALATLVLLGGALSMFRRSSAEMVDVL